MKNLIKIFTVIVFVSAFAQTNAQKIVLDDSKFEVVEKNILNNLDSDINGVVESTLFGIMLIKKEYPAFDYNELRETVYDLSAAGRTPEIRVKAQLCAMYLDFTNWFNDVEFTEKENPSKYFAQISERVQSNLLTAN